MYTNNLVFLKFLIRFLKPIFSQLLNLLLPAWTAGLLD